MQNEKSYEFIKYILDEADKMSLSKLIKNVSKEIHGEEILNVDKDIENRRKKLQEILEKLKIEDILNNELNKTGNKKTVPVYQLLFFRRLLLEADERNSMIKKICKNNFEEITEEEIKSFGEVLFNDFNMWLNCYMEEHKLMDEDLYSFEEIWEIDDDEEIWEGIDDENKTKILYYMETDTQMNRFIDEFLDILRNKRKLDIINKRMLDNVKQIIEEVFRLETINNLKIGSLDKYESNVGVIDLSTSLIYREESLLDYLKLFLFENFNKDFETLLERWKKIIEDFPKELERQRLDFVEEKTDNEPTNEKALDIVKKRLENN